MGPASTISPPLGSRLVLRSTAQDPRQQLVGAERFGQVVIGAGVQSGDPVDLGGAGGQHDDRDRALPPQLPQELEAVESRHHDIEQEQVVASVQGPGKPAPAVVDDFQVDFAAGEESLHQLAELDVVIHEQNGKPRLGRCVLLLRDSGGWFISR